MRTPPLALSLATHLAIFGALALWLRSDQAGTPRGLVLEIVESPRLAPARARRLPSPSKPLPPGASAVREPVPDTASPSSSVTSEAPEARQGLPEAAEEYLVSRMPELKADFRVPYPAEAKRRGIQGSVIIDLLIDSDGRVRETTLVQGPGAGLNEAALEAVKKLEFKPALVADKPVAVRIRYAYRFILEK